jgi:hypothetical protein
MPIIWGFVHVFCLGKCNPVDSLKRCSASALGPVYSEWWDIYSHDQICNNHRSWENLIMSESHPHMTLQWLDLDNITIWYVLRRAWHKNFWNATWMRMINIWGLARLWQTKWTLHVKDRYMNLLFSRDSLLPHHTCSHSCSTKKNLLKSKYHQRLALFH